MATKNVKAATERLEAIKARRGRTEAEVHQLQAELEQLAAKHLPGRAKIRHQLDTAQHTLKLRNANVDKQRAVVRKLKAAGSAHEPHVNKIIWSPCKSSREGVKPRLIVLHLTVSHELAGFSDVESVATFFSHLPTQASSNIIIDGEGYVARCVADADKAWAQAAYNRQALSIEQVGYTDKPSGAAWHKEYQKGLEEAAHWVAWWSHKYDIPLVHSINAGVCEHKDLGLAGGGHVDVGPNYPLAWVIGRAREIRKAWGV